jgi:hypothetical protein
MQPVHTSDPHLRRGLALEPVVAPSAAVLGAVGLAPRPPPQKAALPLQQEIAPDMELALLVARLSAAGLAPMLTSQMTAIPLRRAGRLSAAGLVPMPSPQMVMLPLRLGQALDPTQSASDYRTVRAGAAGRQVVGLEIVLSLPMAALPLQLGLTPGLRPVASVAQSRAAGMPLRIL